MQPQSAGAATTPSRVTPASPTAHRTVLIVDDIAETRELLRWQLSAQPDLEVVGEAVNGDDGLRQAVGLEPDVVILDLYMPGASGLETLAQLTRHLPDCAVVVITSYDSYEARASALGLGAASYIVKGTRRADFLRLVRQAAGLEA
ncbi:hypothetical protein GCM10027596_37130 [Nocardioides korecus]